MEFLNDNCVGKAIEVSVLWYMTVCKFNSELFKDPDELYLAEVQGGPEFLHNQMLPGRMVAFLLEKAGLGDEKTCKINAFARLSTIYDRIREEMKKIEDLKRKEYAKAREGR